MLLPASQRPTVFFRLSMQCGWTLGKFSVYGVPVNCCITAHPNECRSHCIGHYHTLALSLFSLDAWRYNPVCNKVVDWSIARSWCDAEYVQREREGTTDRVELNAGLQTRQEEMYVICFFSLLGGRFYIRSRSGVLALTPLTVKNRGVGLID